MSVGAVDDDTRLLPAAAAEVHVLLDPVHLLLLDNDVKNHWNTKLKRRLLGGGRRPRAETRLQLLTSPAWQHSYFASSALERMQASVRRHRQHQQAAHRLDSPAAAFTLHNYGNQLGGAPLWPSPSPSPSPSPTASESSEIRPRQLVAFTGYSGCGRHLEELRARAASLRAPQRRAGPRRAGLAHRIYAAAARLPNPPRRHLHHGGGGAQHREDAHGGKAPEKKRRRRLAPSTARRRERGRGERGDRGRIEGPQICGLCPKIWWATNFSRLDSRSVGG